MLFSVETSFSLILDKYINIMHVMPASTIMMADFGLQFFPLEQNS